ncbi:MAG: diguanylate cyclase [Campylobacterota bacterium]|nr:diguanylate cyclase [Campylobacterota bacterium]
MTRIILFFAIVFNTLLFAQSGISNSVSYLKLENKPCTLDEILKKNTQGLFAALEKNGSKFGFTDNIFWIKVSSKNYSSSPKVQILEFNHPSLDTIDIYELEDQHLLLKKELGDHRVYDKSTFMPNPNYKFVVSPEEEKVFFIKVISTGTLNIGTSIQDIDSYNLSSSSQIKWLSFYFGALFIMLMYNAILYLIVKNKSFLYYVLFHVSYILFAMSLSGISFELFWPNTPKINNYILPITMPLTGAFALLFAIYFLEIKIANYRLYKFLYALAVISFAISTLVLIAGYSIAIQVGSLLTFFIAAILFFVGLYLVIYKKSINALFYLIAWSFFSIGVIISHLSNIGLVPSILLTNFSSQIGSFFEVLLLSIGLAYYYNRLQKEHTRLTLTNDKLLALSQTDMLTGLYNRRFFYDNVTAILPSEHSLENDFYLFMLDLDHFKKVNDTYGHNVGDQVLVSFADIIRNILRDEDIFARFGGEEFVLFFSSTDKKSVIEIAERINTAVRNATFDFAPGLKITVSIGISHNTLELNKLLGKADKALYKAKETGRDTYVIYDNM